jgi:hypothetical protein
LASSAIPSFFTTQITGKAAGVFDDDGADAIAFDAVEEPREGLATLDRIGTTYRGIVNQSPSAISKPARLAKGLNGSPLPAL